MKKLPHIHKRWPYIVLVVGVIAIAAVWLLLSWHGRLVLNRRKSFQLVVDNKIALQDDRFDYSRYEAAVERVNQTFTLPIRLTIHIENCDEPNSYYDTESHEVVVCSQLIDDFKKTFTDAGEAPQQVHDSTTNALMFITFHEMGHALIDILGIPITGKEEDVADQLSVYVLTHVDVDNGDGGVAVLDGARWFDATSKTYTLEQSDFADAHSLDIQRYYNLACWVYGSDPGRYRETVLDDGLTPDRAEGCQDEYQKLESSWRTLLSAYVIHSKPDMRSIPPSAVRLRESR